MMSWKHGWILVSLVAAMFVTACASGVGTYPVADQGRGYILGIGDTVRINVYGQEDMTGEYMVEPDGTISLPLIKTIPASGLTAPELEQSITDALSPEYLVDPRVSVDIAVFRSMYILGEVQKPGQYPYSPNMTVLQAVATAGGYTYRADESGAEVTRHVKGALSTFRVNEKTMLKPGDTVVVKRRWF